MEVVRYESNPKHRDPWQRGRKGSLCPRIAKEAAQDLLDVSEAAADLGGKRYACLEGLAYCAQSHGPDLWHGYPVGWKEVPETLRRAWIAAGKVRRHDVRRNWDGDSA